MSSNVLDQPAPDISLEVAARIAREAFALEGELKPLVAERDCNFALTTLDLQRYVLKFSHSAEDPGVLDLQNQSFLHLQQYAPEVPAPRLVLTVDGQTGYRYRLPGGDACQVRMVSWLQGRIYNEVAHSPALRHSLGAMTARLDKGLRGFAHSYGLHDLKWRMEQAPEALELLRYIPDAQQRALAQKVLEDFSTRLAPRLGALRGQIIHNDASDCNVLVAEEDPECVCGIIDFGDMTHSALINGLAVACAYAMLESADPLAAAADVVRGYHALTPLEDAELELLPGLMATRLAVSVCISSWRRHQHPDNDYILISQRPAWKVLQTLDQLPAGFAVFHFRQACALEPVPGADAVIDWLASQRGRFASVLDCDVPTARKQLLNLEKGHTELPLDTDAACKAIERHMQAQDLQVMVGRYLEDREVYTTDAFVSEFNPGARRTVHIGLDLFQPAGSGIHAPLDAVVYGCRDNAEDKDYGPTIILRHEVDGGRLCFYTLYGHLSRSSLEGLEVGRSIRRGERFATMGEAHENGGWPPHVHFQLMTDMLGCSDTFAGVAEPDKIETWRSIVPDPNLILGIPEEIFSDEATPVETLLEQRQRLLGPSLSLSYSTPLNIVRGRGCYLYDAGGRAYIDAYNNVAHVGHSHPRVVAAIREQAARLNTNTRYLHDNILRYAERLGGLLPDPLSVCFFVCTGSEANELAIRMARTATGRQGIVAVEGAYHGHTSMLVDVSSYKFDGPGGAGRKDFVGLLPAPDLYRGRYRDPDDAGERYAAHMDEALDGLRTSGYEAAAFLAESMPSSGGVYPLPSGFLKAAYAKARAAGALCLADEVQVGFGRMGTSLWGFEEHGVVPDIVTLGKPIGNGHPMAAVITTERIARAFANGMEYFNTFGGNPVSCAAGMAVLDVLEDEDLVSKADTTGKWLGERLEAICAGHPHVGEVRGQGLFYGIEMVRDRQSREPDAQLAGQLVDHLCHAGILAGTDGIHHNVLKFRPPMVFSKVEGEALTAALATGLKTLDEAQ